VSRRATEAVRGENRTGKRARRDGRNAVFDRKTTLVDGKNAFLIAQACAGLVSAAPLSRFDFLPFTFYF